MNPERDELQRMNLIRRILSLPTVHLSRVASCLDELTAHHARELTDAELWVEVEAAAACLGVSAGHLRRQCLQKFSVDGRAKLVKPDKGKATWWLRRSIDPRLNDAPAARSAQNE